MVGTLREATGQGVKGKGCERSGVCRDIVIGRGMEYWNCNLIFGGGHEWLGGSESWMLCLLGLLAVGELEDERRVFEMA